LTVGKLAVDTELRKLRARGLRVFRVRVGGMRWWRKVPELFCDFGG
jgi:hypothetical protein